MKYFFYLWYSFIIKLMKKNNRLKIEEKNVEVLNDSPRKYCVSTISCVSYKVGERSFGSDIEPDNSTAYYLSWHLLHTHTTTFGIFHMCLVCMFTIIVVAMSQQRSAALYPRFILIRCWFHPVDLKRSESRRCLTLMDHPVLPLHVNSRVSAFTSVL